MYRMGKGSEGGCMTRSSDVPPVVPAYNKFMGGVDRTNQMCGYYLLDRHRCRRSWMRIFIQLFQLTVTNAFTLCQHNCRYYKRQKRMSLQFRQELVELCLNDYSGRKRKVSTEADSTSLVDQDHHLTRLEDIGLKRGRCILSITCKQHTTFGCQCCRVRRCFANYHAQYLTLH